MFNNPNFPIINIQKDLGMNNLRNKNDLSMYSWTIKVVIFSLAFEDLLITNSIWNIIIYMGRWPTLASLHMSSCDDKS
jgi:hypothetical protein